MSDYREFLKTPRTWQIVLVVYWLAIFIATHIPKGVPLQPPNGWDKVAHFTAYAVLAMILAITWQLAGGHLTVRHLVALWLVLVFYGAFDELTQIPVGRDCE